MKRVLLTGIAGFIGSHAAEHLIAETDWEIVGLVSFRHKGDSTRLAHLPADRVKILFHDIRGPIGDRLADEIGPVDYIWNVAAESHVDRSISDPEPFIRNNVELALNMLQYARQAKPKVFIQVSTDEVYGPAPADSDHAEWEPMLPSNPYSASKAAQEAIAISWWRTYGVPVVITNTVNNYGERQDCEKFVPLVIRNVVRGDVVPIHATPGRVNSRNWIHARNHADALLFLSGIEPTLYPDADRPDRYNVAAGVELDNLSMAQEIAGVIGKPLHHELVDAHSHRPGHDPRYALDASKLLNLGWKPPVEFTDSLRRTVEWTLRHPSWLQ